MATISALLVGGTSGIPSRNGDARQPVMLDAKIDFAAALAAKGSALAASDVIKALNVPVGCIVLAAGASIVTPVNSTTCTIGVGYVGSASAWASGFDIQGGAAGAYSTAVAAYNNFGATAGSVDVTLSTMTGTLSTGVIRVWALVLDTTPLFNNVGIALVGS